MDSMGCGGVYMASFGWIWGVVQFSVEVKDGESKRCELCAGVCVGGVVMRVASSPWLAGLSCLDLGGVRWGKNRPVVMVGGCLLEVTDCGVCCLYGFYQKRVHVCLRNY